MVNDILQVLPSMQLSSDHDPGRIRILLLFANSGNFGTNMYVSEIPVEWIYVQQSDPDQSDIHPFFP